MKFRVLLLSKDVLGSGPGCEPISAMTIEKKKKHNSLFEFTLVRLRVVLA